MSKMQSPTKTKPIPKREERFSNDLFTIDDLPLTQEELELVLMWFARKLYALLEEGSGAPDWHHKSYDPLVIEQDDEGNYIAHSYVFDFEDGGRHHPFTDLPQLETMMMNEGIGRIRNMIREE